MWFTLIVNCSLFAVEQENDLLVCGECRTNFPLRDITKFIRHKVNKCNKENVENDNDTLGGNDDGDANNVISSKRTPISAPITRKESVDGLSKSPRVADAEVKTENEEESDDVKDTKDRLPFRPKPVADAESNTTNSGKSSYFYIQNYVIFTVISHVKTYIISLIHLIMFLPW